MFFHVRNCFKSGREHSNVYDYDYNKIKSQNKYYGIDNFYVWQNWIFPITIVVSIFEVQF